MRLFPLILAVLLAGCTAAPVATPPNATPAPAGPTPPPFGPSPPSTAQPPASGPAYQAPDFSEAFPVSRAGQWTSQLRPTDGLPGAAEIPARFVAAQGLAIPVGSGMKLVLGEGCGPARFGLLDPAAGAIAPDGTLTPARPGPLLAYAEQGHRRRYLQIAATAPGPVPQRFGPPAGWALGGSADATELLTSQAALDAVWQRELAASLFPGPDGFVDEPGPQPAAPAIDFARFRVLFFARALHAAEGDPVVTHADAAGLHVVIPGGSPAPGATVARRHRGLYLLPVGPGGRVVVDRADPEPAPAGPAPAAAPGEGCAPAWAWDPAAARVAIDDAGIGSDGDGRPVAPRPLVVEAGATAGVIARAATPAISFSVAAVPAAPDYAPATVLGSPQPLPQAWAPGQPLHTESAVQLNLRFPRPGAWRVKAEAGGLAAHALIAAVDPQPPALRFAFTHDPGAPAAGLAPGGQVLRDGAALGAFWDAAWPALASQAPVVDFTRFSVVALVEDRVAWGERGAPVLATIADTVLLVAPAAAGSPVAPVRRRAATLWLAAKLDPSVRVRLITACDP